MEKDISFEDIYNKSEEKPTKKLLDKQSSISNTNSCFWNYILDCLYGCFSFSYLKI